MVWLEASPENSRKILRPTFEFGKVLSRFSRIAARPTCRPRGLAFLLAALAAKNRPESSQNDLNVKQQ
jgi:hypothetical protein